MRPEVVATATAWARREPAVRALALVGSWARGTPGPASDVDLVVLTDDVVRFVEREDWATELGADGVAATRSWGVLTERRLVLDSGLEVDVGIAPTSWARVDPPDPGTVAVVRGGLEVLHDPDGLLAGIAAAAGIMEG